MYKIKGLPIAQFQHHRLPSPRCIRLLRLQPSSDLSAPLDVTLFTVSIDEVSADGVSNYEALSYVWGVNSGSIPCICDGLNLLITPNCDDALRHLRLASQYRVLWVDSICIDQGISEESLSERNTQITLMGEIYRRAERTLCWLGRGEDYTAGVLERLRRIGSCPSKRELQKLLRHDAPAAGDTRQRIDVPNHIFCHAWHSRVWTLQEVAFSRDCIVICGMETISWNLYVEAAKFLIYNEFIDKLDARAWKHWISIRIREDMRETIFHNAPRGKDGRGDATMSLLASGLTQVRHLEASNPKDKIYGLYAVFSALGIPLPAPNYSKPLGVIYEEACVAVILRSRSLQMLQYASSNARDPSLPGWVADWQDQDVTLFNSAPACAREGSQILQDQLSALSPSPRELLVRGRVMGAVTARAENDFATLEFPPESFPILKGEKYELVNTEVESLRLLVHRVRLFREWMRLLDGVPPPPPVCDNEVDNTLNLLHAIVTFDSTYSYQSPQFPFSLLYNAWADILRYPDTQYDLPYGEKVAQKWKSADTVSGRHEWSTELFHCSVIAAALAMESASRSDQDSPEMLELLAFTSFVSGNMGDRALILIRETLPGVIVPCTAFHMAQTEDCVVLLEGADSPVVLRRTVNKWSFIGPAFVEGMMDGEAWLDKDDVGKGVQNFLLI